MSNAVFPPASGTVRLAWKNSRTPEFRTQIASAENGLESRAIKWVYPRWHWKLNYEVLGQSGHEYGDQLRPIVGHFLVHKGAGDTFLFQDPEDFSMTDQVIGVGNGTTKNFQIVRTYGGFVEPMYEIKSGTLVVKVNGSTTGVTQTNGLVTFISAPALGASITATCQFYFRVRFEQDLQEFENFTYLLHAMREVRLIQEKR